MYLHFDFSNHWFVFIQKFSPRNINRHDSRIQIFAIIHQSAVIIVFAFRNWRRLCILCYCGKLLFVFLFLKTKCGITFPSNIHFARPGGSGGLGRLQPPHIWAKYTICLDFPAKLNLFQPSASPLLRPFRRSCSLIFDKGLYKISNNCEEFTKYDQQDHTENSQLTNS